MIYKDRWANGDKQGCPVSRGGEACINCGFPWPNHSGWRCNRTAGHRNPASTFDGTPSTDRYLTASMEESLRGVCTEAPASYIEAQTSISVAPSAPQNRLYQPLTWKDFRNTRPGECPCGGTRGVCPYHP